MTQHVDNFSVPIGLAHGAVMSTREELLLTVLLEPMMATTASGQSQTAGKPSSHPARVQEFDVANEVLRCISDLPSTKMRFKAIHAYTDQVPSIHTVDFITQHLHNVSSMLGWLAKLHTCLLSEAFCVQLWSITYSTAFACSWLLEKPQWRKFGMLAW